MNEFWQERTPRERALLVLLLVAGLCLIVYSAIYKPMQAEQARLERQANAYEAEIAWMRSKQPELQALRANGGGAPRINPSLAKTSLSTLAQRYGASFSPNIRDHGDGSITAKVDRAPFSAIVSWAHNLTKAGATMTNMNIRRHKKDEGYVTGSFKFKR